LFDDADGDGAMDHGETVLTTTVASSGFSAEISLAEGLHHIRAFQTDEAGNVSGNSPALDITVDTTPPTAPTITSISENDGGGINASEASNGTPVVVGLAGTGAVAGDKLTINWGVFAVDYTLQSADITAHSATVTVSAAT